MSSWFPAYPARRDGAIRLFCLPHAGAGASIYRAWTEALAPSAMVCPVQLKGREDRCSETASRSIGEMAKEFTAALAPRMDDPYALFGYSMGALIAFEAARRIRALGLPMPCGIVLAAHQAPHLPLARKAVWTLSDAEFLRELRGMGGMPDALFAHPELIEFVLPTLRADFEACDRYVCRGEEPLDVPLAVFGGAQDPFVTTELLEAWSEHTLRPMTLRMFPGGHFFLRENRDLLLGALAESVARFGGSAAHEVANFPDGEHQDGK